MIQILALIGGLVLGSAAYYAGFLRGARHGARALVDHMEEQCAEMDFQAAKRARVLIKPVPDRKEVKP